MTKNNILRLAFLLALPVMLTACSDKDNGTEAESSIMEQQKLDSKPFSQDVMIKTSDELDLQELMHRQAQVERQADKYGFVWSTTDAIIDNGYAEAKKGNENGAKALFKEAILQFNLSMEQAKYANQNWKLLIPEND